MYVRNDTGRQIHINTTQTKVTLSNLYPGAGYVIRIAALSHGLLSEPHESFTGNVYGTIFGHFSRSQESKFSCKIL